MLKGINFNSTIPSYSSTQFLISSANIVAIWQHAKRVFGTFSLRMRGNGYLGASGQKSDPAIRSVDLNFLKYGYISTIWWRFRHIFDVLCTIFIWPCDLRPFDLGCVWWIKSFTHKMHIPIFSMLWLSVSELCATQSDHITITWNGHCACAKARDLSPGAKMIHIFEIPDLNLPIYFVTFRELRRRLSYVTCEK